MVGYTPRERLQLFIANYAENHGLQDPGRDLRNGKGRLRIFLPSVMNYMSVYRIYEKSLSLNEVKTLELLEPVSRRTFVRIWQEELPHIIFNNPRTDLCITCEEFKKQLNQVAVTCNEQRDKKKAEIHQQAKKHLQQVRKERA